MIRARKQPEQRFAMWAKMGLIFAFGITGVIAIEWLYQLSGDTTAEFSSPMYEQLGTESGSSSDFVLALLTDQAGSERNFVSSEFTEGDFAREVFPLDDQVSESFYWSDSGIVSFWVPQEKAAEVFDQHQKKLHEQGWKGFKSGGVEAGSYIKSEGVYRWLMLSCTSVSGGTTVVIQYREEQ